MRKNRITNRISARQFRFLLDRAVPPKKSQIWDWFNLKSAITFGVLFTIGVYIITYCELKGQACFYEYTSVPEDLKKKGFTEDLLTRTMNDIQYRINTYTDDIRSNLERGQKMKVNYVRNHNPSYISSIQNMTIEGVPFKALIHFTDKMLSFFGMDVNDNYVSVEFYTTTKKLHASILFKGGRKEFTEYFDEIDPKLPLYNLCYNISVVILEQSHPLELAEYYFNLGEFEKCVRACMSVVASKKYSDSDKSKAYLFWGLSLDHDDYNTKDHSLGIQRKFNEAIKLDGNNHDAKLASLLFDSAKFDEYKGNVIALLRHDSLSYQYWARLLSLKIDTTNHCRNYVKAHERLYSKMKEKPKDHPSEIYWLYGRNLRSCGDKDPVWYDSAISKYRQAVEIESNNENTDLRKLSYYYNSIAYAFESKALAASGNKIDVCLDEGFQNSDSKIALAYLEECHAYARQALSADSLNAFAWSTLGEYYGFQYMISKNDSALANFIDAEKKAYWYSFPQQDGKYSFEIDDCITSEPYCFIKTTNPKKFDEIQNVKRFYDKKNHLRRIRIL